ncbi:reverse transcriptase domain-containing protein [Tanacetum coccineum]
MKNQSKELKNDIKNMMSSFFQMNSPLGSGSLLSNTVANPRGNLKVITTQSGVSYDGPTIPPTSPLLKEVERVPEATKDKVQTTNVGSTTYVQPPVVQVPIPEPDVAPKPNPKPSIPYPSRLNNQKLREKANNQMLNLISNKEKLFELANTPLNENCSAVLLKKLPKKLGDPGKFLIPYDFSELDECLALADLGASINLMPLSVWKKLSLSELTLTRMPLELANRSVAYPVGVAKDVFMKLTLRINDEAITFNVGHTSRYSYRYDDESVNRIDVIDVTCEEYAQEVLEFLDSSKSGNPTPSLDPIITTSSPSLTPFEGGDFVLEEIEACLTSDSIPPGIDDADFDPEGDILLLEKLLNDDPSSPLPPKELNFEELKIIKSSIDDPPELELKDLPSHLEYAFLEGTNKLPVIIAKKLKDDEKGCLLKVLKSHKRAIAWKISDIKGIDPQFCTHKILMEDDFKTGLVPTSKSGGMTVVTNEDNELIPTRLVTGWRICIDYRKLNDATCKDHFPLPFMDQTKRRPPSLALMGRLPTDVCLSAHVMLWACSKEAPILVACGWDLPFEIMCDASDFAVGAVLGQRAENLTADHLSRLENPHQGDLEKKEINETFPLETLRMISFHGTPCRVTHVNVKSKSRKRTKCPKIQFKYARSLTYEALNLWAHSYLLEGTSTFSWPLTTCLNGLKQKTLPTNDARVVVNFLKSLFARFGTPHAIISDRSTHFCNDQFSKVMLKYGFTHRLSTTYHPQTSGQVEVSNCGLKRILERTVGENRASWSDKLDDALWAFSTTFKTPIECTPYKLVYGKACHLPIELEHKAYWALKHCNFDLKSAGDHRKVQMNELNKLQDQAYENSLIYKEKTKKIHESKIKNCVFNVGDRVLHFNSRLKIFSGKLKTRWTRPFTVTQVFPYGTVELSQTDGPNFKVNGHTSF